MTPTRTAALHQLTAFAPHMAADYATRRNYDLGARSTVSRLSPYLRCRLATEPEVIATAIAHHGAKPSAKFIDEVIWRSYFKGWLELRPSIWREYHDGIATDLAALTPDQHRLYASVIQGNSGTKCMDIWAQELVTQGYLHNHARMWFASIWVFGLGLPWRLGADFFMQHLLDGDAASNTLGWRWVAGLHTAGKTYHAKPDNIATFTNDRITPSQADVAQKYPGPTSAPLPATSPLRPHMAPNTQPSLLLITDQDCALQDFDLSRLDLRAAATMTTSALKSPHAISDAVQAFEAGALSDTAQRIGWPNATPLTANDPAPLITAAQTCGATQIITPFATTGPLRDWLLAASPQITAAGITLAELQRPWDAMIWPDCTPGFFKVKQNIPRYLATPNMLPTIKDQP
jgi:deoxyribodipyrimidine photo-lyase